MPYIIVLVSHCKYMLLFLICNFRNEQSINIRGALEIESGVKVSEFVIGIGSIDTTQGIVQTHALLLPKQSDHVLGQFFYHITFTSHNTVRYLRAFSVLKKYCMLDSFMYFSSSSSCSLVIIPPMNRRI